MKTTKSKHKFSHATLIVVALVLFVLAIFTLEVTGVTHFLNTANNQKIEQKKDSDVNSNNKRDFIKDNANYVTENNSTQEHTPDDISISTKREVDGNLVILTQLKNYSDGTCELVIKNGNSIYTQTATVIYQSDFSTCAGFSVPSGAVAHGTWQISLMVTSNNKVNTKTISVEVQ